MLPQDNTILGVIGKKDKKFRRVCHIPTHFSGFKTHEGNGFYKMQLIPHPTDSNQNPRIVTIHKSRFVEKPNPAANPLLRLDYKNKQQHVAA